MPAIGNWSELWPGGIDAAVNWGNDIYFFKENEYIRYNKKKNESVVGYPRLIERGWPKLWGSGQQRWEDQYAPDPSPRGYSTE